MQHDDIVRQLAEELDTHLTLGYIGNCSPRYDDRQWYVWLDDYRTDRVTPSVWLGRTAAMIALSPIELAAKIRACHAALVFAETGCSCADSCHLDPLCPQSPVSDAKVAA